MAFSIVHSGTGTTSVSIAGVAAGNLIVMNIRWTNDASTSCSVSDGTSSFEMTSVVSISTQRMQFAYLLISNSGDLTFTVTFPASTHTQRLELYEVDYANTVVLDDTNTGAGTGATATSGTISTTGTVEIVFGGGGNTIGRYSNEKIAGAAVDGTVAYNDYNYLSYKTFSSTQTNIAASHSDDKSGDWTCSIIAFKEVSGLSIPLVQSIYRRRRI